MSSPQSPRSPRSTLSPPRSPPPRKKIMLCSTDTPSSPPPRPPPRKKLVLCSSDNEIFVVDEEAMLLSGVIKHMIENKIPCGIINVEAKTFKKVFHYCFMHTHVMKHSKDGLKSWDAKFASVDPSTAYDLIIAAENLDIKSLSNLLFSTFFGM